ncbi:eiger [Carabus blaptoides fortunei]
MCTKQEEPTVYGRKLVKNNDVNVTINKQQTATSCSSASNLCANETHSVDFRIQTNIEFISHRKIKFCLLINMLISVICISGSFFIIYKLYAELLQIQNQMILLNARMSTLSDTCAERLVSENGMRPVTDAYHTSVESTLPLDDTRDVDHEEENDLEERTSDIRDNTAHVQDGALAAHFKGSLPEIHIQNQGLVGPWYPDTSVSRQYKFPKFHLTEGQCSIEVTETALYLIYAQVYYITSSAVNSYTVFVRSEGSSDNNVVARCSSIGPNSSHIAEISCFTSTVYNLKTNDRIFIQQTEKNRTIILRDGHSFFGLVRLNNSRGRK